MKKNITDFIKDHKYINYCEAIIYKDGTIDYACPSHVEALIKETKKSRNKIYELMPIEASPIEWLVDYTNAIAVYTNGFLKPKKCSKIQLESLEELIKSGLTKKIEFRY